jgi:hypothetical protein
MTMQDRPEHPAPASGGSPVSPPILLLDETVQQTVADPGIVVLTCANCGAPMDERKCKLICRCGYFLSCSDYY